MLGHAYGSAEIRHSLRRSPDSVEPQASGVLGPERDAALLARSFELQWRDGQNALLRDYAAGMAAMVRSIIKENRAAALRVAGDRAIPDNSLRLITRVCLPPLPQPEPLLPHALEPFVEVEPAVLPEAA